MRSVGCDQGLPHIQVSLSYCIGLFIIANSNYITLFDFYGPCVRATKN